jgi:hypothetical protein
MNESEGAAMTVRTNEVKRAGVVGVFDLSGTFQLTDPEFEA